MENKYKIVIIGGGIAGLSCALELVLNNVNIDDICLLEAQHYLGGRVLQSKDIVKGMELDVGAEFIHGDGTTIDEIAEEEGIRKREIFTWAHGDGGPSDEPVNNRFGYYQIGSSFDQNSKLLKYNSPNKEFQRFNDELKNIGDRYVGRDIKYTESLEDFMERLGFSDDLINLADNSYANTQGGIMENMSGLIIGRLSRLWDFEGDGDSRMNPSYSRLIKYLCQNNIKDHTILNFPVKYIDYSSDIITIQSEDGRRIYCDYLVSTISIAAYQSEYMHFNPPLPYPKIKAISSLRMDSGLKCILQFKNKIQFDDCAAVLFSEDLFPEIWFREYEQNIPDYDYDNNPTETKWMAFGFAVSRNADNIIELGEEVAINKMLEQLDNIFRTKDNLYPASNNFICGNLHVWNRDTKPYIGGAYSYPLYGVSPDVYNILSQPIENRLFFAGEAMSNTGSMTVHAALDSGKRAAHEVIDLGLSENHWDRINPPKSYHPFHIHERFQLKARL